MSSTDSPAPRILAFAGSLRRDSFNKKLVRLAARGAEQAGAMVTLVDLADYPLPVFDEDLEAQGTPESATRLKRLFLDHQGLLIATPEYNGSLPAALKNALDWVSRRAEGEPRLAAFQGKTAAVISASTGVFAGVRSQHHLRAILNHVGVNVLGQTVMLGEAGSAFDLQGELLDADTQARTLAVGSALARVLRKD